MGGTAGSVTFRPLLDYHQALLRGPSPLTEAERELIAAYVSGLNACRYCHGVHTATAEAFGMPGDTMSALLADVATAPVPERMKPLLRYVGKLTLTPAKITPGHAAPVLPEGNVSLPPEDVRREHLARTRAWSVCPWKGVARYYTVRAGGHVNQNAAWYYSHPSPLARKIKNHVAFWNGVQVDTGAGG